MLNLGQPKVGDDFISLVVQDNHQEVCRTPMSIKIENDNDEDIFWDDLETFIMELDTLHMLSKDIDQVQKFVDEETAMKFKVQEHE